MPSRRISANLNLAPVQEIAVNPYSSFNSDNVNMLTRIVTGGKNKDFVVAGLDVTGVNTISETLGANILTEHFTSGITGWTGSNVVWDSGTQSAKASIPPLITVINATLTYNTLISNTYIGQYIKVQFTLTDIPKSLFVTVGNETKSYDHPLAGSYTCYLQLSDKGPSPLSLVFTIQLDNSDLNSNSIVYLDNVIVDPVINLGTDINPITLPTVSTPDLYQGTNLDSTNIPFSMLHPHITSHILPGVCIKDETTLCFTGTNATTPILTLDYSNAINWISGIPFTVLDFPNGTPTYYSINGGSAIGTSFTGGLLNTTLVDDGGGPNVTKIVGKTTGVNGAYVKWAYLVVYYSYFKNPIPNNAYIGLATESEITDARYGEDYLILAKLRFVDTKTVDAIIYYPDRKDLAYNDATRITYNNITQLKYWDTKPLNVSQALDELAYKFSTLSGGGGVGGGTGEFNIRWGTAQGWTATFPYVPSGTSNSEWSAAYGLNVLTWSWCTITWNTDHWVATTSLTGEPFANLSNAITQWTNPTQKAYVVFNGSDFRIVNPINPPGDNFVRGPLTSEVVASSPKLFLAADGAWEVPVASSSTTHSTLVFQNYTEFQTWVITGTGNNYVWNTVSKLAMSTSDDYSRLIFITCDNTWWRTPRDSSEAMLISSWSGTPTINSVPQIFQPISSEFEVRWGTSGGTSVGTINSDWSAAYTANSSIWVWSNISWDPTNFKWIASTAVGSPFAPTTNWTAATGAYPTRAYVVYNATSSNTTFRIVNPYNPMGNGLVVGPKTSEVQESSNTLYLAADGTWKSVATQDSSANGDFYTDNHNGSTNSNIVLTPVNNTLGGVNTVPIIFIDGMRMRFIASMNNTVVYNNFVVSSVSGVGYNGPNTDIVFIQQSLSQYTIADNSWAINSTNSGPSTIWTVDDSTHTYHFTLTISGNNQPLPPTAVFIASIGGIGTFTIIPSVSSTGITTVNIWNPNTLTLLPGGPRIIVKNGIGLNSTPVTAGDIQTGQVYELTYSLSNDQIIVSEGLLKTMGTNVLYADFDNNSGTLDLSSYNINPADQATFQVLLKNQISNLTESHLNVNPNTLIVGSTHMVEITSGAVAPGGTTNQLFQGNGAGAFLWRHWVMNQSSGTTLTNTGTNSSTDSVMYWNGSGLSAGNVSSMQTKTTTARSYNPPNYGFLWNSNVPKFIDLGTVPTDTSPLLPSTLTLSFWINYMKNGNYMEVYCRSTNASTDYFQLYLDSSGRLYQTLTGTNYQLAPAAAFSSNHWNHTSITYSGGSFNVGDPNTTWYNPDTNALWANNTNLTNPICSYINGGAAIIPGGKQYVVSSNGNFNAGYGTGFHASIGRRGAYNQYYYNGRMSEFRLYNIALTPTQVGDIYRYGNTSANCSGNLSTTNLVRYFYLNDNTTNNNVLDYSGNGGTAHTYTTDYTIPANTKDQATFLWKLNGALAFNLNTIVVGTLSQYTFDLNTTSNFTYAFWLMDKGANTGTHQAIFSKPYGTASYPWDIIYNYDDGSMGVHTDDAYTQIIAPSDMHNGMHVALTCNYRTITVYINGVYYKSYTTGNVLNYPGHVDTNSPQQPYIGSRHGNSWFFNGVLDDFRIYSKVLPLIDIQAIYNNGNGTEDLLITTPTDATDYYSNTTQLTTVSNNTIFTVTFPYPLLLDNIIFRNKYGNIGSPSYASNLWEVVSKLGGNTVQDLKLSVDGITQQNIGTLQFNGTLVDSLVFTYTGVTGRLDNISILFFNRSGELNITLDKVNKIPLLSPEGSFEYLNLLDTNQIINMKYNAGSNTFNMLDPAFDLELVNEILTTGVYKGSATIAATGLNCNIDTSGVTYAVTPDSNFVSNYNFFNTTNDILLTSITNTNTGNPPAPVLWNYWWRLLPYNIPYGTKKIIIQTIQSDLQTGGYNMNITIVMDLINSIMTTKMIVVSNHVTWERNFIDKFSKGLYNTISNVVTHNSYNYYASVFFDDNFIYSLPGSSLPSDWNVSVIITSYR